MSEAVLYERDQRGVVTITLNRPEKRNALSTDLLDALLEAFRRADQDEDARVVVLTGAGEKAFSAGGDLAKFTAEAEAGNLVQGGRFVELFETMGKLGVPIIGRINGHCLAGAFGVALACDILISVDEASFGTPEILVGLWPMMIGALIYRNLPRKLANELILTGRRISAAEAETAGIINRAVARSDLDSAVDELCDTLVNHPPAVVRMGRQALFEQQDKAFLNALTFLEERLQAVLQTEDALEGMRAFLEKRTPQFTGR